MRYAELRGPKTGPFRVAALALGVGLVGPGLRAHAAQGPACEVVLQRSDGSAVSDMIQCNDCDQSCDDDGVTMANKSCTFMLQTCANQPGAGCPVDLKKKIKGKGRCGAGKLGIAGPGTNSMCGSPVPIKVKTTMKGKKPGKCKIQVIAKSSDKPPKVKVEKLTLVCSPTPQGGQCPPKTTTTTTTTTITTTTTQPGCAEPNPNCCPSATSLLKFTTGMPQLGSRTCSTTDGVVTGTTKNSAGTVLCNLRAGGLYTGGSGEAVPLPSVVPDMGSSFTKTTA